MCGGGRGEGCREGGRTPGPIAQLQDLYDPLARALSNANKASRLVKLEVVGETARRPNAGVIIVILLTSSTWTRGTVDDGR